MKKQELIQLINDLKNGYGRRRLHNLSNVDFYTLAWHFQKPGMDFQGEVQVFFTVIHGENDRRKLKYGDDYLEGMSPKWEKEDLR